MIVHGLLQTARGMCTDECPHHEIDALLAQAVDAVKELEDQRDAAVIMRAALTPHSTTLNEAVESRPQPLDTAAIAEAQAEVDAGRMSVLEATYFYDVLAFENANPSPTEGDAA